MANGKVGILEKQPIEYAFGEGFLRAAPERGAVNLLSLLKLRVAQVDAVAPTRLFLKQAVDDVGNQHPAHCMQEIQIKVVVGAVGVQQTG